MMNCRHLSLVCLLLVPCGCSSSASSETGPVSPTATVDAPPSGGPASEAASVPAAVATPEPVAPKKVALNLLEWDGVKQTIESHKGKVVVVDCWATYCVPCRKEFPGLVKLSHQLPSDVVCISVSLDDRDDRDAALEFLQEEKAFITNVLCTTDTDTLYDQILKVGSIPAVFVYGRDGKLARTFTGENPDGGEYTYEQHITPFVRELVSQK